MVRRPLLIGIGGACASVALVFAAAASPATRTASAKEPVLSCSNPIQLGMMGPFTGPVASIGDDQLHWAQFFANNWNLTHKMKLTIVQGDTQLDPAKASVVAQSMASNSSILGVIGPAGSQEVTAVGPDPQEGRAHVHLRLGDERDADRRQAARATSSASSRTTASRRRRRPTT